MYGILGQVYETDIEKVTEGLGPLVLAGWPGITGPLESVLRICFSALFSL